MTTRLVIIQCAGYIIKFMIVNCCGNGEKVGWRKDEQYERETERQRKRERERERERDREKGREKS